jgi:filamentous hemagglutinin
MTDYGFRVEQLEEPSTPGGKPDLRVNGELADVYSPKTSAMRTIDLTVKDKVANQAPNIVLNLEDCPMSPTEITTHFRTNPVPGLRSMYFIKNGRLSVITF